MNLNPTSRSAADSLQKIHNLSHEKHRLNIKILLANEPPEFLHRSLLVDLVL